MAISSIPNASYQLNFNGIKRTKRGVNYHHSNAGLAVGAGLGAAAAGIWTSLGNFKVTPEYLDILREMKLTPQQVIANIKQQEYLKSKAPLFGIIATAATIGCGAIIDMIRNKKAQAIAEQATIQGPQQTCMTNIEARMTPYGTAYHHSYAGKRNGAILGVACALAHGLMVKNLKNIPVMLAFTLGGFIAGAITDKIANNKAQNTPVLY